MKKVKPQWRSIALKDAIKISYEVSDTAITPARTG